MKLTYVTESEILDYASNSDKISLKVFHNLFNFLNQIEIPFIAENIIIDDKVQFIWKLNDENEIKEVIENSHLTEIDLKLIDYIWLKIIIDESDLILYSILDDNEITTLKNLKSTELYEILNDPCE